MSKSINLYLHVHQPFRIKNYTIFEAGNDPEYFNEKKDGDLTNNSFVLKKVSEKSYIPTNKLLLELLNKYPDFKLSLSITGTVIEQFESYAPYVLESFKDLVNTGRVEIVAETYHHSLAFFYSINEFERQVRMHQHKIEEIFGVTPKVFRNTELAYNNDLAQWADKKGYLGILSEGWDPILQWRSPNYLYRPVNTESIKLFLKNYKLSDDIAFRFSDKKWSQFPMDVDKFINWLDSDSNSELFNLFMDYETFGEHQWAESGIFEFLSSLPNRWLSIGNSFTTLSEAANNFEPKDFVNTPETVTWADNERDLTAWTGNSMQNEAIKAIYSLEDSILATANDELIDKWRKLQTSDHFYYMCTKWFNDGDVHAYFSPYTSPYDAFINFMNCWHDIVYRLRNLSGDLDG